jgi:DNA-binding XRE family transcriptional regulator
MKWSDNPTRNGMWIRQTRMKLHISQGDLAKVVGCSRVTMSRIERGIGEESKFFMPAYWYLRDRYCEHYKIKS